MRNSTYICRKYMWQELYVTICCSQHVLITFLLSIFEWIVAWRAKRDRPRLSRFAFTSLWMVCSRCFNADGLWISPRRIFCDSPKDLTPGRFPEFLSHLRLWRATVADVSLEIESRNINQQPAYSAALKLPINEPTVLGWVVSYIYFLADSSLGEWLWPVFLTACCHNQAARFWYHCV